MFVDAEELCSCRNLPLAIGLYFAAFYVLNLSFPPHSCRTLLFLQKYALHVNETTRDKAIIKASRACTALMEKLNKSKCRKVKWHSKPSTTTPANTLASGDNTANETTLSEYSTEWYTDMETDDIEPDHDIATDYEPERASITKGSSTSKLKSLPKSTTFLLATEGGKSVPIASQGVEPGMKSTMKRSLTSKLKSSSKSSTTEPVENSVGSLLNSASIVSDIEPRVKSSEKGISRSKLTSDRKSASKQGGRVEKTKRIKKQESKKSEKHQAEEGRED